MSIVRKSVAGILLMLSAGYLPHVLAQNISAAVQARAAKEYDIGWKLYRDGKHHLAVTHFLAANSIYPSDAALVAAARAALRAEDYTKAAAISIKYMAGYEHLQTVPLTGMPKIVCLPKAEYDRFESELIDKLKDFRAVSHNQALPVRENEF